MGNLVVMSTDNLVICMYVCICKLCRCMYLCVEMYMCMNMIVSCMFMCEHIAFVCTLRLCTAL